MSTITAEILTHAEIEERFKDEWILVGDPELDESNHVVRGRVLAHSPDRDEVYRQAVEQAPGDFATMFTGKPPADMEFAL